MQDPFTESSQPNNPLQQIETLLEGLSKKNEIERNENDTTKQKSKTNKKSNMSSNKKIDNAIYKKSFLAFFKEIFFELYPNHKTINNEKYQNFKNFYYNIKFFLNQNNKEDYQNKWEHYLSDMRMINEHKKQKIKNTALTMLIKALETDSEKIDLPALFVELGQKIKELKPEILEKIFDGIEIIKENNNDEKFKLLKKRMINSETKRKNHQNQNQNKKKKESDDLNENQNKKLSRSNVELDPNFSGLPYKKIKLNESNAISSLENAPLQLVRASHAPIKDSIIMDIQKEFEIHEKFEKEEPKIEKKESNIEKIVKNDKKQQKNIKRNSTQTIQIQNPALITQSSNVLKHKLSNSSLQTDECKTIQCLNEEVLSKLNVFCGYTYNHTKRIAPSLIVDKKSDDNNNKNEEIMSSYNEKIRRDMLGTNIIFPYIDNTNKMIPQNHSHSHHRQHNSKIIYPTQNYPYQNSYHNSIISNLPNNISNNLQKTHKVIENHNIFLSNFNEKNEILNNNNNLMKEISPKFDSNHNLDIMKRNISNNNNNNGNNLMYSWEHNQINKDNFPERIIGKDLHSKSEYDGNISEKFHSKKKSNKKSKEKKPNYNNNIEFPTRIYPAKIIETNERIENPNFIAFPNNTYPGYFQTINPNNSDRQDNMSTALSFQNPYLINGNYPSFAINTRDYRNYGQINPIGNNAINIPRVMINGPSYELIGNQNNFNYYHDGRNFQGDKKMGSMILKRYI